MKQSTRPALFACNVPVVLQSGVCFCGDARARVSGACLRGAFFYISHMRPMKDQQAARWHRGPETG